MMKDANLDETIIKKLMRILGQNPYVQFFRRLKDLGSFQNLQIRIAANVKQDQRVYNAPSADQVAAIWVEGNNQDVPFERDIVLHVHSGSSHRIKHYYGCYDPLQYPLFFPKGQMGWNRFIIRGQLNDPNSVAKFTSIANMLESEQQGKQYILKSHFFNCSEFNYLTYNV